MGNMVHWVVGKTRKAIAKQRIQPNQRKKTGSAGLIKARHPEENAKEQATS